MNRLKLVLTIAFFVAFVLIGAYYLIAAAIVA